MKDNPYEILGVPEDANNDDIKAAYRKKAKDTHPDVEGGNSEQFQRVHSAFVTLSDSSKRAKYDSGDTSEDINPYGVALNRILAVFQEIVDKAEIDYIKTHNIVKQITNTLEAELDEVERAIRQLTQLEKSYKNKLSEIKKRMKAKGKVPAQIFEQVLLTKIRQVTNGKNKAKQDEQILEQALDILDSFEYCFEDVIKSFEDEGVDVPRWMLEHYRSDGGQ